MRVTVRPANAAGTPFLDATPAVHGGIPIRHEREPGPRLYGEG